MCPKTPLINHVILITVGWRQTSHSMSWITFPGHQVGVLAECLNSSSWRAALSSGPHTKKMYALLEELLFLRWIRPISWIANSGSAQRTAVLHCPYSLNRKINRTPRDILSYSHYAHTAIFTCNSINKCWYAAKKDVVLMIIFFNNCTWMQHFHKFSCLIALTFDRICQFKETQHVVLYLFGLIY